MSPCIRSIVENQLKSLSMTNFNRVYHERSPLFHEIVHRDRSCIQSHYLHFGLFCCNCDPYNHVFDISFTDNGARACGVA